jgi:hypothetical protein
MSLILAAKTRSGILLAADAAAADVSPDGEVRRFPIRRFHRLSSEAAILTGGAPEGEAICRELAGFVSEEGLRFVEEIHSAAVPFLSSAHERVMRKKCEAPTVDPIHHLHFLLAGRSADSDGDPYRIFLIWTKRRLPQLDSDEVEAVYAVPRMIGLEHGLYRLWREGKEADAFVPPIREAFRKQESALEDVSGPFVLATISEAGCRELP